MSRMPKDRIPKQLLFGQPEQGHRHQCCPKVRYKDFIKVNIKSCGIDFLHFEKLSNDRTSWRSLCHSSLQHFKENRIRRLQAQRQKRKEQIVPTNKSFVCQSCGKECRSKQVFNPTRDTEDTKESHHWLSVDMPSYI